MQNDISSVTLTDLVRIFSRNGSIVGEDCLVEVTGVEPVSEKAAHGPTTSVVSDLI